MSLIQLTADISSYCGYVSLHFASLFLRAWLVRATNVNLRNGCGVCILTPAEDASRSWTEVVLKNGRCGFSNPPVSHMQNKLQTPHPLSTY